MGAKSLPSLWANSDARALRLAMLWGRQLVLPPGTAVAKFSSASCTIVAEGCGIFGFAAAELEAVVRVIWRQLGGQRRGQQERVQAVSYTHLRAHET